MKAFLTLLLVLSIGINAYILGFVDNNDNGLSKLRSKVTQDADSLVYRNDQIKKELQDMTAKYDIYHRYVDKMEKYQYTGTYLGEYQKNPDYMQAEIKTSLFSKEMFYFELTDNARNDLVKNQINNDDYVDLVYFKTTDTNEAPFNHYVVYRIRKHN